MSALGAFVLSRFTKPSSAPAVRTRHDLTQDFEQALTSIQHLLPQAPDVVRGKTILDFGSGEGWHTLAFAALGARKVYGIDIESPKIERSRGRARGKGLERETVFETTVPEDAVGACDFIFSRDSMEHYAEPESILALMKRCLSPTGKIVISFGPTWYSPYGAHMNYFTPIPWVHLLFSEHSIMTVRAQFRDDGARRYDEVPGGLNKMSVAHFERLITNCGLRVTHMQKHCVWKKDWLGNIPGIRELFINAIDCQLDARRC